MSNTEYKKLQADPVTELISPGQAGSRIKVKRAQLKVIKGPDKGLEELIPLHGLTVGKGPSCNFVLTDPAVSAEHFRLVPTEKGFHIQDLGSSNGTWLQKYCVGSAYIANRTKIDVGYSTLRLDVLDGHEEYSLSRSSNFGDMIGQSVAMRQVFALLEQAATSDATLLLEGETGTGKDLAAETVHFFSARREKPFVVVDCGNLQSNLVESQLFGHVKGAFTGATTDRKGAFEAAQGGTVFLDEIGELDPPLQPKLLRVLETRQVQRIGETVYRPVDVRLIAATNRHLESEMNLGRFRNDLFYRIAVLQVHIPPLRDRPGDIALIAAAIMQHMDQNIDPEDILSDDVLKMFVSHHWPGNVRELRNVIERLLLFPEWPECAIATDSEQYRSSSAAAPLDLPYLKAKNLVVERFEEQYLRALLKACDGMVIRAAEKAKISRQSLHYLMRKHGILKSTSDE